MATVLTVHHSTVALASSHARRLRSRGSPRPPSTAALELLEALAQVGWVEPAVAAEHDVRESAGARRLPHPARRHVEELGYVGVGEEPIGQDPGRKFAAHGFTPPLLLGFGNRAATL